MIVHTSTTRTVHMHIITRAPVTRSCRFWELNIKSNSESSGEVKSITKLELWGGAKEIWEFSGSCGGCQRSVRRRNRRPSALPAQRAASSKDAHSVHAQLHGPVASLPPHPYGTIDGIG